MDPLKSCLLDHPKYHRIISAVSSTPILSSNATSQTNQTLKGQFTQKWTHLHAVLNPWLTFFCGTPPLSFFVIFSVKKVTILNKKGYFLLSMVLWRTFNIQGTFPMHQRVFKSFVTLRKCFNKLSLVLWGSKYGSSVASLRNTLFGTFSFKGFQAQKEQKKNTIKIVHMTIFIQYALYPVS